MIKKVKKAISNPKLAIKRIRQNFFDFSTLPGIKKRKIKEINASFNFQDGCKLLLITAYNKNYKQLGEICSSRIKKYSKLNGYGYMVFESENLTSRPYPWSKILCLYLALTDTLKAKLYSWVMWIDADAFIINYDYDLIARIINTAGPKTELIITKDICGLNTGVIIFKNSSFAKKLLEKIWSCAKFTDHPWWEQAALLELVSKNWQGLQDKICYVDQHILNAYTYGLYDKSFAEGELTQNSFIYHIPGRIPIEEKVRIINNFNSKKLTKK